VQDPIHKVVSQRESLDKQAIEPRRVEEDDDIEIFEQDLAPYFGKRNQRYFDE
jgi:hypothetical protein